MEKIIAKGSKRKKRRTRRNLDEIRKRTLQVYSNNYNETICKLINPKVISCITNGRLTLAKAIRSETVTRPLLLNLNQEKNRDVIALPNREQPRDTIFSDVNYYKNTIPFKLSSKSKNPLPNFTEGNNHKTSDSIILFSSSENEKTENNITINDFLSDSSASSFVMLSDNSLYSEFMTNTVNYLQEFASDFLKTDNVFKANFLQSIICNKNKNISHLQTHMNINVANTKLTISDNDETINHRTKGHNDINIKYSLEPRNIPSPGLQLGHENYFQKSISSSSTTGSGKDSPEYFYYPHRLNH